MQPEWGLELLLVLLIVFLLIRDALKRATTCMGVVVGGVLVISSHDLRVLTAIHRLGVVRGLIVGAI